MKLTNAAVLDDDFKFRIHDLCFENGIISDNSADEFAEDCTDCYIVPGLIDIHIHGAMGFDNMDLSYEAVNTISYFLAKNGVTTFLPTLITQSKKWLTNAAVNIKSAKERGVTGADIAGIYMEGPYFSAKHKGAHDENFLRAPSCEEFDEIYERCGGLVKIIGIAPELDGAIDFIKAEKNRVKISIGHTDADYETAMSAIDAGATQLIHTFNAMRPFLHREPNAIGAAFDSNIFCECICDGFHLSPAAVRLIYKAVGENRMILITDAVRAAGMADGKYELGGLPITVTGGKAYTQTGAIAGGTSTLFKCVKKAVEFGIPLEKAVMMASKTPARAIGLFHDRGSISVGKRADLLVLNKDLTVRKVILNGKPLLNRQ